MERLTQKVLRQKAMDCNEAYYAIWNGIGNVFEKEHTYIVTRSEFNAMMAQYRVEHKGTKFSIGGK